MGRANNASRRKRRNAGQSTLSEPSIKPVLPLQHEDIYAETATWFCENRKTGYKTRIQGTLAQVLAKYPADYNLRLLKIKETP